MICTSEKESSVDSKSFNMPYRFTFDDSNGSTRFSCQLECDQCTATLSGGRRCSRRVCLGLPLCWQHLRSRNLIIKDSPLEGKGLFAWAPKNDDSIVFREGDFIISYDGEQTSDIQKYQRYGHATGPYALQRNAHLFIDAACKRGAGSFANGSRNGVKHNARFAYSSAKTMAIRATKNIRNGTEIIASYGPSYWNRPQHAHRTKKCK